MESTSEVKQHIPSFFKLLMGSSAEEMCSEEETVVTPVVDEWKGKTVTGFICCVLGCFSNSLRYADLSSYSILNEALVRYHEEPLSLQILLLLTFSIHHHHLTEGSK